MLKLYKTISMISKSKITALLTGNQLSLSLTLYLNLFSYLNRKIFNLVAFWAVTTLNYVRFVNHSSYKGWSLNIFGISEKLNIELLNTLSFCRYYFSILDINKLMKRYTNLNSLLLINFFCYLYFCYVHNYCFKEYFCIIIETKC